MMQTVLELKQITKRYPGVIALNQVSISFQKGEIHALMGENGAGKSTLIKIISGAVAADEGTVEIHGNVYHKMTPAESKQERVGVIYQEFNLIPSLSVAENIFLGDRVGGRYIADFEKMKARASQIFEELGVSINPERMVGELSVSQQQIVEIAKAISKNAEVLIMDEPSAAIANVEVARLLEIVKKLKQKGVTIIYISHRMDEIFSIADRISVMRDGRYVGTSVTEQISRKELITQMVGRELAENYPERGGQSPEVVMEVKGLSGNGDRDISFCLHKGEILGLAGLVGAGRTELAKLLYGAVRAESGEIWIRGKQVRIGSPKQAIDLGIGLIPENRKTEGTHLEYPIDWNITVMSLKRLAKGLVVSAQKAEQLADEFAKRLRIKTPSLQQQVCTLSGGNQQKVVLAKVLAAQTDIIIFDEPTRGIDVGAKQEIYQLMDELTKEGVSIIMISSEMEELIGMSDRIIVLYEGRQAGESARHEFDQKKILKMASGL